MKEKTTAHSTYKIGFHLVWTTKFRHPVLVGEVELAAKRILSQTCVVYGWEIHNCEVMPDHVHMFISFPPTQTPSEAVKTLKSISAVHLFYQFPYMKQKKFWGTGLWSKGAYYGTVGDMSEEVVKRYIDNQKSKQ